MNGLGFFSLMLIILCIFDLQNSVIVSSFGYIFFFLCLSWYNHLAMITLVKPVDSVDVTNRQGQGHSLKKLPT